MNDTISNYVVGNHWLLLFYVCGCCSVYFFSLQVVMVFAEFGSIQRKILWEINEFLFKNLLNN